MPYGLLPTGFQPKTMQVIIEEVNALFHAEYGTSFDMSNRTPQGHIVGIMAEREALLWEILEAIVSSTDPDAAFGVYLDSLLALSGTIRRSATRSTAMLTLTGDAATAVPQGTQFSNRVTGERFATDISATLYSVPARATMTAYSLGDRVTNTGSVYIAIVAGTSSIGVGYLGKTPSNIDGPFLRWRYLGEGAAVADVPATSLNTGEIVGISGDITVIENPISGLDGVINITDADLGTTLETDGEARLRRESILTTSGSATIDALRSDLLEVPGVTRVTIFQNTSDYVNSDGLPGHSIEALIQGGDNQDIFDALLANVAAGIGTFGGIPGTATDELGNVFAMAFSRPTPIVIYVEVTLEYDADEYPADGDAQVKAAIVTYGDRQDTGKNVVSSAIKAQCFKIPGVLDVSIAYIGLSPAPTSDTTIQISLRELAIYDTSRISVTSSPGTP